MRIQARVWAGGVLAMALVGIAVAVVNGQNGTDQAPLPAYHFEVKIEGEGQTYRFRSCSGLKIETEVVEYRDGGDPDVIRKLAGPTRYANIRLTRAFTGDRSLYDWYVATKKPQPVKVDGRITMFDRQGRRLAAWTFTSGFPAKWEGPDLDASKNEIAIETIEIAHEGLKFSDDD